METMLPEVAGSISSVSAPSKPAPRTEWPERHTEEFLSLPFISEFVFRSLHTKQHKKKEEVADFLILHRGTGILIEQKCQEDPVSRTSTKTELWVRKKAKQGWSQLRRAFTRQKNLPIWCDHPRLGPREFRDGIPPVQHGIVIVETFRSVDLEPDAASLPLDYNGVPIAYLSVNDFLNLAVQLRSVPELTDYLKARRSLPHADLRVIGDEETLFGFYLLNDGSFAGCTGRAAARAAVAAQEERLREALDRKYKSDRDAYLLESVADALATRNPQFAERLSADMAAAYDPADQRTNYLEMQAVLADLRLRERAVLGGALRGATERVHDRAKGFSFMAARLDSMPEWVYVFGASMKQDRAELLPKIMILMRAALTFYGKRNCLVVVDRDGDGFEVALSRPGFHPTEEDRELGERLFGGLRITSAPLHFVPVT